MAGKKGMRMRRPRQTQAEAEEYERQVDAWYRDAKELRARAMEEKRVHRLRLGPARPVRCFDGYLRRWVTREASLIY